LGRVAERQCGSGVSGTGQVVNASS